MSGSFVITALWGLLVLVAFLGWGGAIAAWLFPSRPSDPGLRAVWGMSLALLAGGLACLLHVASFAIHAFLIVGALLAATQAIRARATFQIDRNAWWRELREKPGSSLLLVLCVAAVGIQYLASIWNIEFNPNDDFIAYFPFAKQILQQGTLFDPFSTRRAMSLGGQSFLHALVLAGVPGFRLHLLDQGICTVMAALLLFGDARESRWPRLLALLVLITLPDIRANTYPQMSGTVIFYGIYRTLAWLDGAERTVLRNALIVALVGSAACTLRSNFIAVAVPLLAISYLFLFRKGSRMQPLKEAGAAAGFAFLFLLPWMVLSQQSSGTPLFPLLKGNFNNAFPMLQAPTNWHQQIKDFAGTMQGNRLLYPFPLLFIAGLLLVESNPRKPVKSLLFASLIGWLLLVHTLASDIPSFARYVEGFVVAGALAVIMSSAGTPLRRMRQHAVLVATALAVAVQLFLVGGAALNAYSHALSKLRIVLPLPIRALQDTPAAKGVRALQARVPVGAPMLVMVDHPFLFDFRRNPIYNADTAAAVSPPPGFPYFQGAERVAAYLRSQSITHLAYTRPERAISLFNRKVWERQASEDHFLWRAQAPYYLDIFSNFERLAETRRRTYEDDFLLLVDLSQPPLRK
jgi:hypothetical protein